MHCAEDAHILSLLALVKVRVVLSLCITFVSYSPALWCAYAGRERLFVLMVPTRLVFFERSLWARGNEVKKLSIVTFLPFSRKGSISLQCGRPVHIFPQMRASIQHALCLHICCKPELNTRFIWLIWHILGEAAA